MSSPTVQIFQPGMESGGISMARLVLPQADGKRRGDVVSLALRILDADDEHVLGQPALVARLPAGDAQRVAFLAEQCIAAVAGAVALDRELFGEVHDEAAIRDRARRWNAVPSRIVAVARDALERRRGPCAS